MPRVLSHYGAVGEVMFGGLVRSSIRTACATRRVSNTQQRKKHGMTLSDELIRDRAYQLWLKAGSPTGQNRIHWDRARAELEREQFDVERQDAAVTE
jgi:hypothetical protein